jgi:hypothetical protein
LEPDQVCTTVSAASEDLSKKNDSGARLCDLLLMLHNRPGAASAKLIRSRRKWSFDNLVGLAAQLRRRREAEMLCRFHVVIGCSWKLSGGSAGFSPLRVLLA